MRIIGGKFNGKILKVPNGLPVRPTTDFAKEALFNILQGKFDYDQISMLDLFAGTGHISYEFASRGTTSITSVDQSFKCCGYIRSISQELNFRIQVVKADVFDFLKKDKQKYDLIFADPPYDLDKIPLIHELVSANELLNKDGLLIIEHGAKTKLDSLKGFQSQRKYGNVNFSFFRNLTEG